MKWILIGHRGVGKSQFLQRLKIYYEKTDLAFFDLDQLIEAEFQKPLIKLFPEIGETSFRQIEQEAFQKINHQHANYVLSVGAGFFCENIPSDIHVIWIRRSTDELGRIFMNRPRLNSQVSAHEEFMERFSKRQALYQAAADEVYWMPEGIEVAHPVEKKIFKRQTSENLLAKGILTLQPWHLKKANSPCLGYGCDFLELRDDFIFIEDRKWIPIPQQNRLLSFRDRKSTASSLQFLSQMAQSDWALELGPCPTSEISILSCHEYRPNENLDQFLIRLEKQSLPRQHLKAAPQIRSYAELEALIRWQEENPSGRSILPRSHFSESGKWLWARLYLKGRQKLNFWRDSDGSAPDQPTLFEWLSTPESSTHFAALLGNPVIHSRTMLEQSEFFAKMNWPIWAIRLQESELNLALPFLISKGLRAAAVTSPLKIQANRLCQVKTAEALELQSVNTLWISESATEKIVGGHNTDLLGLEKLSEKASSQLNISIPDLTAVIWGGGGTLSPLRKIWPQAMELSVRSGQPRNPQDTSPAHVNLLIWAAGPRESFPPEIKFDLLLDLNYREDSKARELAMNQGKPYLGGDLMFKAQAAAQRQYWTSLLGKPF